MKFPPPKPSTKPPSFIVPAKIDDAGLTPVQFRVLARIARRAGEDGHCYESLPNMAKACRIRRDTLQSALNSLIHPIGLVQKIERPGQTSMYRLTTEADTKRKADEMRQNFERSQKEELARKEELGLQTVKHPAGKRSYKGIPLEG